MIIRFGDLESDQSTLKGELETDIFQIDTDADIRSIGPVSCDFHISVEGEHLIVDGSLTCPSQMRCVGCLEDFPYIWGANDYHAEVKIENDRQIDLTEYIRDDILLKIPNNPRCTDGELPDRICPMNGPFSFESKGEAPSSDQAGGNQPPDVWDALENLDTGDH